MSNFWKRIFRFPLRELPQIVIRWGVLFRIKPAVIIWSVLVPSTLVMGFNCGRSGFQTTEELSSGMGFESPNIPVGLLNSEQIYKSMLQMTGVSAPQSEDAASSGPAADPGDRLRAIDREILAVFANRQGSLPSQVDVRNTTSPMMIAVTDLSLSVCSKLVHTEQMGSPRFFENWSFAPGASAVGPAQISSSAQAMARSYWGRDLSDEETQILQEVLLGEFQNGLPSDIGERNRQVAVGLCAAQLSSFEALVY